LASQSITKYERMAGRIKRYQAELKLSGRIGTHALLTGAGGVIAGYVEARFKVIPNTTLNTNAALGVGLVISALAGMWDDYSDEIGATGAGVLAFALGQESKAYFDEGLFS
jgi:hypothetical protein